MAGTPKWGVVVPTCRPGQFEEFVVAWGFDSVSDELQLFACHDLDGERDWPEWIPSRSDMCRSWGFYRAWAAGCEYILSLDDDVRPVWGLEDLLYQYERVFTTPQPVSEYLDVGAWTGSGLQMRGFPKDVEYTFPLLQYGGWDVIPDLDGETQLANPQARSAFQPLVLPVPKGVPLTGCAMNMAFHRDLVPAMWQLPLLEGRYNRFGDIWSGLFAKKVCDAVGAAVVVNGRAVVRHERASDPVANAEKEAPGIPVNEGLWASLGCRNRRDIAGAYKAVTDRAALYFVPRDVEYAHHFVHCRNEWLDLFR